VQILRDAAPGIHQVTDAYTNWFLVEAGDGVTVVDAGVPRSWRSLHAAVGELGLALGDVSAIVLTHAHSTTSGSRRRRARSSASTSGCIRTTRR
jgi:glyoxylase-like metal-dependent hydrolase (beta-lactamase superfamily II)